MITAILFLPALVTALWLIDASAFKRVHRFDWLRRCGDFIMRPPPLAATLRPVETLEHKIAEQERIIDDQCDTIVDLVNTLDARDIQ